MHLRLLPTLLLLLLPLAGPVQARPTEAAPPEAAPPQAASTGEPEEEASGEEEVPADALPPELPAELPERKAAPVLEARRAVPAGGEAPQARTEPARLTVAPRAPVRPLLSPTLTDAQLEQAFRAWRQALGQVDGAAAERAQAALVALRRDFDLGSLEPLAVAFLRAADERRAAGDTLQAVALAQGAVALAPDLPAAHLGLAHAALVADPTSVGRVLGAVGEAVQATWRHPGTARAAVANLGAALLLALVATTAVCAGVLFLRRARLYFHAVHHLLPRLAARWQAVAFGLALLALPLVLGLGLLTALLALLLAVALSLGRAERGVAAVLLVLVGLVPWAAGVLVERTAFVGTPAEQVAVLEGGGLGAEAVAARVEARRQEGRATYAELFALGRFQARRGLHREAAQSLEAAAALRPGDARLMTNLGNVLFASGNPEGAAQLYQDAAQRDAQLAAPLANLAVLRARRAGQLEHGDAVREQGLADEARLKALALEPALAARPPPPEGRELATLLLVSPPLAAGELAQLATAPEAGRRVSEQLAHGLSGTDSPLGAAALALGGALLLLLLGQAGGVLGASRACERCGGSACRRCDRELPAGSALCSQCVAVFVRKGAVSAHARVRKQLEVERARERRQRVASVLALLVSGGGHLFSGRPVRGALYAFAFLGALGGLLLHQGLVRVPHGSAGAALLPLVPLLPLLLVVHLLSVRGLLRQRARD